MKTTGNEEIDKIVSKLLEKEIGLVDGGRAELIESHVILKTVKDVSGHEYMLALMYSKGCWKFVVEGRYIDIFASSCFEEAVEAMDKYIGIEENRGFEDAYFDYSECLLDETRDKLNHRWKFRLKHNKKDGFYYTIAMRGGDCARLYKKANADRMWDAVKTKTPWVISDMIAACNNDVFNYRNPYSRVYRFMYRLHVFGMKPLFNRFIRRPYRVFTGKN